MVERWRAEWPLLAVVGVALLLAFAGLHTVLEGWGWWWWALALTVLSLMAGLTARVLGWGRVWAPVASLVVLVIAVVARFAAGTAALGFVPTPETLEVFRRLVRDSTYSITWQTVPARADESISFVLTLGVVVVLVLAEIVVFSLRAPAFVGLLLAAMFLVPTIPPEGEWSRPLFVATAIAYLVLLLLRPRERRGGAPGGVRSRGAGAGIRSWSAVGVVVGVAVSAVTAGMLVPAVLPSTDVAVTTNELGPPVASGANPILRLGDDLRRSEALPVLTYSTVSGGGLYLRLSEIVDFTGEEWESERPVLAPERRPVDLPRAPGLDLGVSTRAEVGFVRVGNLQSPWLPVPYPASRVTGLVGEWKWVPESLTIASDGSLAAGEVFTVESVRVVPTPQQLEAAGSRVPEGLERYLELPTVPAAVSAAAHEFTAGAGSSYERAVALQQALRSSAFRYSEDAPVAQGYDATNLEAIAAFLDAGAGYCIHFASAMAVMARALDIPSRIMVGFQPGSRQHGSDAGRTLYAVTTHDLHAWPELYFDGLGWVAFEPTPSRGSLPVYANPVVEGVPSVGGVAPPAGGPVEVAEPFAPQIDDGPTVAGWLTSTNLTGLFALGGVLLLAGVLALVPAGVRLLLRRRRLALVRSGRGSALVAWREVLDSAADVGVELDRGQTPRAVVLRLSRARGISDAGRAALERLCAAVELSEFGPPGTTGAAPSLADDAELVVSCLLVGLDADRRARAHLLAPSLVSGTRDWLRRR